MFKCGDQVVLRCEFDGLQDDNLRMVVGSAAINIKLFA